MFTLGRAMFTHELESASIQARYLNPEDRAAVTTVVQDLNPEAFVCANDRTAGHLMHTLIASGYGIPQQFRLVGIDDVRYASLLPVPLTTVHQPCHEIGEVAIAAMIERIARPQLPPREILLDCELVVRKSCGAGAPLL
jgi:DNA-binding LacI/PurR family transcriptional regulator